MSSQRRRVLRFLGPRQVSVETQPLPQPAADEVRVDTVLSAVSPGTEKLVYRGEAPAGETGDAALDSLSSGLDFPFLYGYSCVGHVTAVGDEVSTEWRGRRVFSFQPHVSHFTATPDVLLPLPDELSWTEGVLIPNAETAVNLVMDGAPILGEDVVVFGQGVVGLLTTALLAAHPIGALYTVEPDATRRKWSEAFGAHQSFPPASSETLAEALDVSGEPQSINGSTYQGADLIFELSGIPDVLNHALEIIGFDGRIVLGSWYGKRRAPIDLGGRFHRSRVSLISSQVSTVAPTYQGRWSTDRRMETVLNLLPDLGLERVVQDPVPIDHAPEIYDQMDRGEAPLQPLFEYNRK